MTAMATSPKDAVTNMAGKLWRFIAREPDSFTQFELAALHRVVRSHNDLPEDAKSREGLTACGDFLEHLASAAAALGAPAASRRYRAAFTANYRAIFPDGARTYRVDVLEGGLEQPAHIWVNGDQFQLGPETLACADALRSAWARLGALFDRWPARPDNAPTHRRPAEAGPPKRQELMEAFRAFDVAWASLEHLYINELIAIEGKARSLVVEAIALEKRLALLEASAESGAALDGEALEHAQRDLVQSVCRLNSVANHHRKGRDDLGAEILAAAQVLRFRGGADAASALAADIVNAFASIRRYLRQVEACLECVDPHLCNNAGLVARLVDWEESWEVGRRYITDAPLRHCLCDLVASMQMLQVLEPTLASMCEDCDVELFLVLPRLLVLRFLAAPDRPTELLRGLIPHRFLPSSDANQPQPGPELAELVTSFERVRHVAPAASAARAPDAGAADAEAVGAANAAWELFARAAVRGFRAGLRADAGEAAAPVQDFMRELERWSVEVQRHHPEDWNQCSAVLVQCLSSGGKPQTQRQPSGFDI